MAFPLHTLSNKIVYNYMLEENPKRREFLVAHISFVKLLHSPDVLIRKTTYTRHLRLEECRKRGYCAFFLSSGGSLFTDNPSDLPVHSNHSPINGSKCSGLSIVICIYFCRVAFTSSNLHSLLQVTEMEIAAFSSISKGCTAEQGHMMRSLSSLFPLKEHLFPRDP